PGVRRRPGRRRPGGGDRPAGAAGAPRRARRHPVDQQSIGGANRSDRRGTVRVVIAEDHVLLADGIARLIAAHGDEVVATVGEAPALVAAVGAHRPDVAVVDVRLPPGFGDDGIRAALDVRGRWPGVGILVLSQYVETVYA